jgi:autotransporter-associated beta strand protein
MKNTSAIHQTRLFIKRKLIMCALLALTAPLAAVAQQTVFYDTFGSSTLNQTNAFPGGTPTASSTSYTCASPKVAPNFSISSGHLEVYCPSTSSANSEVQAMFTRYPVTLASVGDYVELTYTFTDMTNQMNNVGGNGSGFHMGLYNSGGTPPLGGTNLQNGGLGSGTTADVGGTSNWVGYAAQMDFSQTAITAWGLFTRPVQTIAQNINQELLYNDNNPKGVSLSTATNFLAPLPFPNLTIGSQYTGQLRITLSAVGTLTISNALYAGIGTGGTLIFNNVTTNGVTTTNVLTTSFDGLALGFRAVGGGVAWTNDINSITVVAGLANQPGPYFTLTNLSGGSGCGSADIGLNGSVTTNVYLLYTNGVFTGHSILGTGSVLDFGLQTLAGVYTIFGSNIVTAVVGPMYGSQIISQSAPVITSQPANASCVTNYVASFTVAATGNTLTYQWYKNGIALTSGGDFSGVNTTNLIVSPAQAADAATPANGYSVVVRDPCGDSITSSPNASLTLQAPNNLVWQGGNPNNAWDLATTLNFTNRAGAFEAFSNADIVTFNDTSANTGVVISNSLVATLVTVSGTQSYSFAGPGSITGFGGLIDNDTAVVTITSANNYTGGTVISSNATLNLGDNSSTADDGLLGGVVTINTNGVLNYNYYQNETIANTLAGNGTVNYESSYGGTLTLPISAVNSNFTGVANLVAGVRVHAQTGGSFAFGNGSTVNVPAGTQAYCDTETYNNTFNIAGTGWSGVTPTTGAISVYGCIFTGAINLLANARISGTISGGTILCAISGPYQLEIWGNVGSYVLSMGPTNGVHSYASTLITAGSVLALNTNAISTGPLAMDVAGDLRLNGNNLTVSNLSSVTGNPNSFTNTGPTIQNIGTNTATLTVGADNSSQEFDGIFFNGGTAPLGLTKIGAGTLTLTAASTNTGTVAVKGGTLMMTGSGSFSNATAIAVGSGATYDVTGAGGTLTLNSGQTLTGSGTVHGNVSASSGSVINPGDSIGTLTITGNATLAGGLTMELNRTNSPATNDSLVVSGTLTAGGVLTVQNLGPALHVGDKFKLFTHSVTGFSAINLPATDGNGYGYTWVNNIGVDGSIQVLTAAPAIANFSFRSVINGNWSDVSTWQQSTNGINWVAAVGTPDYTASNILIQTGTTVTNLLAVTVDHVTVQTNATVLLTTGSITITNSTAPVDFLVAGTLNVGTGGGIINNAALAVLVFTNGGAYVWNNAVIPAIPTATWRDGSTCRISAMATGLVLGISGQSFYDFIWDTTVAGQASRGRLNITGTSTVIRHDFTVTIPSTSGASMTIYNDTNSVLTVGRNVALNGGTTANSIKILLANAGGSTNNLFKVGGNFTATGYIDGFGNCSTLFDFNGTGSQSLTLPASGYLLTPAAMNWQVEAGSSVVLASSVQAFNTFTNNGTLTFGANAITGGGTLVLNSGGTVSGNGTNMLVSGISSIVNGGTLNLGSLPTFAGGESFTLFSASAYSGTFGTLLPATPDGTHTWVTTQLNTAGILAVSGGVNTNAPKVQVSVSANTLHIAWPTNAGWTLLTNSVGLTAANQWFPYPNSANLTNVNITMDPTKTNVFFRMVYPYP